MSQAADVELKLMEWIREHHDGDAVELTPQTQVIKQRVLTSLQIADLLLYIEELRGTPVDPTMLKPGVFSDVETIRATFFPESGDDGE